MKLCTKLYAKVCANLESVALAIAAVALLLLLATGCAAATGDRAPARPVRVEPAIARPLVPCARPNCCGCCDARDLCCCWHGVDKCTCDKPKDPTWR